jgi:hypothetical protein
MSGGKGLDGAGIAKMVTLEEAVNILTRVHSLVERMAIEVRGNKPTTGFRQQIQRASTPLVGMLKGQFGMISDQVAAMIVSMSRGSSEQTRLRSLRESVAQIRTALEIAIAQTAQKHAVQKDAKSDSSTDTFE